VNVQGPNAPLDTPWLRLEPLRREHAPVMLAVLADPRMYRYLPGDPPADESALAERYARLETRSSPGGTQRWLNWVVLTEAGAVGRVEASVDLAAQRADVAYLFHPDAWGQGYASEALEAMLRHLRLLGVRQAQATIDTRNAASLKSVRHLGFTDHHTVYGADEFKGSISDEAVYRLTLE
jgi:[ribosomal protein S5]-alanine N-acetyltransferase